VLGQGLTSLKSTSYGSIRNCQTPAAERRNGFECGCSTALFRILQEALTNVARHSQATKVYVELAVDGSHVSLTVRDNGRGVTEDELAAPGSLGLLGMRERAVLLGGDFLVRGEPGKG
jgi:signal transduction histidine kinase